MTITRENYEAYMLDYLEGTLPDDLRQELLVFLENNPELDPGNLSDVHAELIPDTSTRSNWINLRRKLADKSITPENCAEFFIALHEGLLDEALKNKLDKFILNHPDKTIEIQSYGKVYLKPDFNIIFNRKDEILKKKRKSLVRYLFPLAVAASVAVIVAMLLRGPLQVNDKVNNTAGIIENESTETPVSDVKDDPKDIDNLPVQKEENLLSSTKASSKVINVSENKNNINELNHEIDDTRTDNQMLAMATPLSAGRVTTDNPVPAIHVSFSNTAGPSMHRTVRKDDYKTVTEFVKDKAREIVPVPTDETGGFSLFAIARAGINGINKVTGTELALERQYAEDGKVKGVLFEAGKLEIYKPVKKVSN